MNIEVQNQTKQFFSAIEEGQVFLYGCNYFLKGRDLRGKPIGVMLSNGAIYEFDSKASCVMVNAKVIIGD